MDVPRCAPDTYPKNPCYANMPYNGGNNHCSIWYMKKTNYNDRISWQTTSI